jgi:hypothetical protein
MEEKFMHGKLKGKAEALLENAVKMKQLGIAPEVIIQVTGLSRDEMVMI